MQIRLLDPYSDRAMVDAFFRTAADYIRLERGEDSGSEVTEEFFTDTPPGCDPSANLKFGLFDSEMIGVADLAFGYPGPTDGYIGLMIISPAARGRGAGPVLLRYLEHLARARHMQGLYLGVLDANPKGRAFWEREGFTLALANRPVTIGTKTQIAHRLGKAL
ncbi:MAG: GNAT family N-acetyltransferase [bacterium]